MHDDLQLIRQLDMEKCLKDGQLPCRWAPDFGYGYGLPLFNYYPPLPYIVGQIFRTFGASFVSTVKNTAILQIFLSALFMYVLVSSLFGPIGGFISSLLYTYAPYHAVNIYVRGAMNEAWASVFFPLLFYFSKKYIEKRSITSLVFLSVSLSLFLLSHNPMVMVFSPIVFAWSLFWIFRQSSTIRIKLIINLGQAVIYGFCLSAFFTLPVLLESKYVQLDRMFTDYYQYNNHFVSLYQLFISNFWGDGGSIWGPNDGMSFSIGYLQWGIPLLITFYLSYKYLKTRTLNILQIITLSLIAVGLFTTFLTHERSTFIWQIISPLQKLQFPWRFLNITMFIFALSAGYIATIIQPFSSKIKSIALSVFVILILLFNLSHFTPVTYGPITDNQKFSGEAWKNQITGGLYDYLPITASTAPEQPAAEFIDQISPNSAKYIITGGKKGTDWLFFNVELNIPATIYLPIFAYPNFRVNIDGQNYQYQIEPKLGRISLFLNSGHHQVYVKLHNTDIRSFSNLISFASLIILILFLVTRYGRSRNKQYKK